MPAEQFQDLAQVALVDMEVRDQAVGIKLDLLLLKPVPPGRVCVARLPRCRAVAGGRLKWVADVGGAGAGAG